MNDSVIVRLEPAYTVTQETVGLSGRRPVRVQRVELNGQTVRPHNHAYYEVFLVLEGNCHHWTPTGPQPFFAGNVAVLAPGRIHAIDATKATAVNLYYLAEWLLDDLPLLWSEYGLIAVFLEQALFQRSAWLDVPQFQLDAVGLQACAHELQELEAEIARAHPSPPFLKATLTKCLCRLARSAVQAQQVRAFGFREEVWAYLSAVEEALSRGEAVPGGMPEVTTTLSRDHLSRLVREATGMSATGYFQKRRIQHAAVRLLNPTRTVTEVALECGYADAAHISRYFRRFLGQTPSAYRKAYAPTGTDTGPEVVPV
ncbi:MAG: helix-turn-helix domain-containing protein [Opitutales bacterium]